MSGRSKQTEKVGTRKLGLIFVDDSLPGITRRRHGRGWCYRDVKGQRIASRAEIGRLNAIALPPAYTDAWFCPAPNGHVLATGIDARGRKQYRYHPDFRAERENAKFDRTAAFGKALPLIRMRVEDDLAQSGIGRERAIASVVRLLDLGRVRIGNETYARRNASFGATTLRCRHVEIDGQHLSLRYKGKSGKLREVTLSDKSLSRFVRQVQELPGQNLFQYLDDAGEAHRVSSGDVNEYLRDTMGEDFSAKDFRTFHASALAFARLAGAKEDVTIKALMEAVSDKLGNTPAVARRSYVHPAIVDLVGDQARWRETLSLPRRTRWLSREERGMIAMLEETGLKESGGKETAAAKCGIAA